MLRYLSILLSLLVVSRVTVAQANTTLRVKGLTGQVEVLRDKWGVNHIYAANQHDLFFAQGYCAAKDRLFQFEIWRRQATGTLAEILGPREIQRDIGARLFSYRGDMDKELNHYHPQGKAIITAFTEGVNAYIDEINRHPEQLPAEFQLLHIKPGKWTPAVVVSRHQGILNNVAEELNIGRAVATVGADKVKDLLWLHPGNPSLTIDSAINGSLLYDDILAVYNAWRKDVAFATEDIQETGAIAGISINEQGSYKPLPAEMEGSNNWVIGGARTVGGHALLASDPHRKITIPSLRYIVHLSAPGWNVTGGGEPEIPGVAIGHNDNGAWGITIHQTDAEDLYVYDLNPQHLNQYWHKGQWLTMRSLQETITVKDHKAVTTIVRYTVHGPVTFIDSVHHKAYAIRAGWLQQGAAPYLASLRMDQAQSWTAFREACSFSRLPALNMIWADKQGNIGWQVTGLIPVRNNFSGLVPVPGDGRYEWNGCLPIKERPHVANPVKGYWATANEDLVPADFKYPQAMGFTWPDAYRGKRIEQVLSATTQMDMAKMKALQTDYVSLPAQQIIPLLKQLPFDDPLVQQAKDQLLSWDFIMYRSSIGAAIYNKWERELMEQANKKFIPGSIRTLLSLQTTKLVMWLQEPDARFGNTPIDGRNEFLKETFIAAVGKLKTQLGNNITTWQYGQQAYKHIEFIHPLSPLLNRQWQQKLNTGSLPRSGYGHTVGATGNMDNQGNGASFRYITDTGDWDNTLMINTPGQSGDPASPWYSNLFGTWAMDEYFPAYFSKTKIQQVTAERLLMQPAK
ncbi:MAG: penicillin acylase family protein [Chitinophagaceae bacterium]